MTDRDWVDKMLHDALDGEPLSQDYQDFEIEYDAIIAGMKARRGRSGICAAAALATATSALRGAADMKPIPSKEDMETIHQWVGTLVKCLTVEQLTYLPAALATLFLRKDDTDEPTGN